MNFEEAGVADLARLTHDLRLGFGSNIEVCVVDAHHSKSQKLPIVAAKCEGWNTSVAWYAFNYHNHYAAFRFRQALPATLLWPISSTFGRKHMSGHEADCPLPDVTNFTKDYWNRRLFEGFACFAGDWHMATTLRYLEAVSKIDQKALFDVVMDQTHHGKVDNIDGNSVGFKAMSQVAGIPLLDTYGENIVMPSNKIVKSIEVDWFGIRTGIHPTCVEIVAHPGVLLPASTGTGTVNVEPRDTRLAGWLNEATQPRWTSETPYADRAFTFLPTNVFKYWQRDHADCVARNKQLDATPYRACGAYNVTNFGATRFRFQVPNPLDAVLFVKWWLEAGIPCAEEALAGLDARQG